MRIIPRPDTGSATLIFH